MKKLHGIRVVAKAQKRHRRNGQKYSQKNSPESKGIDFLVNMYRGYSEHTLYRRF